MRLSRGWREAAVFVVLYKTYETARSHIHPAAGPSIHHAEDLVRLERALGLFQEGRIQRAFSDHIAVLQFWDIYYGTIHFVVPVIALWLLWRRRPERYARARTALLVMCFGALAVFILYPLAPPRYMPAHYGFIDTAARYGGLGPLDSGKMKDTNPFAAMPSLHIGWSVWSAWVLVPLLSRRPLKVLAAVYPLVTLTAIVVTANHWLLDAAGGLLAFGSALAAVTVAPRVRRRSRGGEELVEGHDGRILGPPKPPDGPVPPLRGRPGVSSGMPFGLRRPRPGTEHLRP